MPIATVWSRLIASLVIGIALAQSTSGIRSDEAKKPRKIVLIAGPLDAGHPRGTHEYEKSVRLLKHCLDAAKLTYPIRTEVHLSGFPADARTLEDADGIVLFASGSDRKESDHPFLPPDRLACIDRQMRRGCGLMFVHWCTFVPKETAGDKVLEWIGGYFDYESGPKPSGWYSKIQVAKTKALLATPRHPIARGLQPFELRDEYYYHLRFRERDPRLVPILTTSLPNEKEEQVVAWAVERQDGGRGFGFTGGHYFDNWEVEGFRRLLLNATLWTAQADVPPEGVISRMPTAAELDAIPVSDGRSPTTQLKVVPGQFGMALDARQGAVSLSGEDKYRQPPLTVECWARLYSRGQFNILVASDPKHSSEHWELYTYAGSGRLSAYLPGYEPSEIIAPLNVCDKNWHHVAMTFDGAWVQLFADGRLVHKQAVRRKPGLSPVPGALMIGQVRGEGYQIGCDGFIDEVRISRGTRTLQDVPTTQFAEDPQTLGLWHFDSLEGLKPDPAWTPPPAVGNAEPWEKETDADWIDGRLREMDTGPFFNATFEHPTWQGKNRVFKGTAIRLGDKGEGGVLFDRNQLRLACTWTGLFLKHSDRRFGLLNTPVPGGSLGFAMASGAGWADANGQWTNPHPATAPLPSSWGRYLGLHQQGKRVVLSYEIAGTKVLESPWLQGDGNTRFVTRSIEVMPRQRPLTCLLAEMPSDGKVTTTSSGEILCVAEKEGLTHAVFVRSQTKLELRSHRRLEATWPADASARILEAAYWTGPSDQLAGFIAAAKASTPPATLAARTKPAAGRWGEPLVTTGEVGTDHGPFVIDTLTVPHQNRHKALLFLTGVDFLSDGTVAVCTAHGDVWLVRGVDDTLRNLRWQRFATGLYQPLGLKVVDGKIHVLERGQLTRLHDLNEDGEADYLENVNGDWHVGGGEHSFDTCLETDSQGRFYFFKTGDTDTPTGGCLMRIAKDGSRAETFATGFRHPIGLGISPTDQVSGADQEGNWMPSTRLDFYRLGGFYGDMRAHHRAQPPKTYDPPFCWIPRQADNSAGGQVWIPPNRFGPLGGSMLHLSYGRCSALLALPQQLGDTVQGGVTDVGLRFLSGVMRGRFHPRDGHLYLAGLDGWQTAAKQDGCLQRVRYTGRPVTLPTQLSIHENGIHVRFAQPLDPQAAAAVKNFTVRQWNYRWSGDYGSKRWTVRDPDKQGEDDVALRGVALDVDHRGVFLKTATLQPVMQMHIDFDLKTASGLPCKGTIYNTIHKLAPVARN